MNATERLLDRFYSAFSKRDADGMAACYHPDVRFSDPVFPDLRGDRAVAMWRMLCEAGKDLRVEYGDIAADDSTGQAHWEADYTFGTGRKVHNVIDSTFEFEDGKIIRHTDAFNLGRWAAQALGTPGRLFGGTSFMQKKIRATAAARLQKYIDRG